MTKYKEGNTKLSTSKGWTKNSFGVKFYRKNNWVIKLYEDGIIYWILDESYVTGYYLTCNKQEFLEELHMLKLRKSPVWRALHGEYDE